VTAPAALRVETFVAVDAVKRALAIARDGVGSQRVAAKEGRDLVTGADVAVEDTVRALLTEALGVPVVGEERGGEVAGGSAYWLVDPICGTRNFASGIPLYCVNVALVERDEITVAVVGDPSTGELVLAERGRGAYRFEDGARHRLTTSAASRTIVIEDGKAKGERRERAARFTAAAIRADRWDFRSLGSTLASPYVAAGRIAAYAVFWVSAVHAGAGSLLVTEAGGCVSDVDGRPWTLRSDSFVGSADRRLHEELLALEAR
jgi:myo-inositol-1(or 4)-monophosphatase